MSLLFSLKVENGILALTLRYQNERLCTNSSSSNHTWKGTSTMQYATITVDVYQVCVGVDSLVTMGVVLHQGCSESQWDI